MEILVEIFIEVFGEIIAELLTGLFSLYCDKVNCNSKFKKITKYTIASLIFSGCLVLLILSLVYKTAIYVRIIIIYFIILLVFYILRFIFKSNNNKKLNNIVSYSIRATHYVFPIVLIVFASIIKNAGSVFLIVFSSLALFIYLCINIYRINNHAKKKKKSYSRFAKDCNRTLNSKFKDKEENIKRLTINHYIENKDYFIRYINECNVEQFKIILKYIALNYSKLIYENNLHNEIKNASSRFLDVDLNTLLDLLDEKIKKHEKQFI